jgi:YD repeat-containing protein
VLEWSLHNFDKSQQKGHTGRCTVLGQPLRVAACLVGGALWWCTGTALAGPTYDCGGTATAYDAVGNVVVTAQGTATCLVYDDATVTLNGRLNAAAPLGSGNITSTVYDAEGRLTSDSGTLPSANSYDATGRLTSDINSAGTEQYFYDSQNRLTSESGLSGGTITQTMYDASGRLTQLTDPNGTTSFSYDSEGRLAETALGTADTAFTYDATNRLIKETITTGAVTDDVTNFGYDASGRVISAVDTLGNTISFSYDAGTGLLDQVDSNGSITTYTYDASGLLSGATDSNGATRLVYTVDVPEPSSLALFGAAALGAFAARRRRRM